MPASLLWPSVPFPSPQPWSSQRPSLCSPGMSHFRGEQGSDCLIFAQASLLPTAFNHLESACHLEQASLKPADVWLEILHASPSQGLWLRGHILSREAVR